MKQKNIILPIFGTIFSAALLAGCASEPTPLPQEDATSPVQSEDATVEDDSSQSEELSDAQSDSVAENVIQAVQNEYGNDIIILEFDDIDDNNEYDIEFYSPTDDTIYEVDVDIQDYAVHLDENEGTPDSDERAKIDAVELDILDTIRTVEDTSGAPVEEFELDKDDNEVIYEFEQQNDMEYEVNATTGDVADDR